MNGAGQGGGGGPRSWWLAARMTCWTALLPPLLRVLPVARVVHLVVPGGTGARAHDRDPDRIVALAQTVTARLRRRPETRCLVRSLVVYRYLLRAGLEPELRVGFEKTATGLRGHAWVLVNGVPVTDRAEDLAALTPAMTFAGGAVRTR